MNKDCYIDFGVGTFALLNVPESQSRLLESIYASRFSSTPPEFFEYAVEIKQASFVRRVIKPQRIVAIEGQQPFNPVPPDRMLPSLEWAMNWAIAAFDHSKLIIHSGVLVKNGKAMLMPATSGSGKSTLSAYLGAQEWSLYSDELALIDPQTECVFPLFRPASIKNESIDVLDKLGLQKYRSEVTYGTHKGNIAHYQLNSAEAFSAFKPVPVSHVIFPEYVAGSPTEIEPVSSIEGFAIMVRQSFNYNVLGKLGFDVLSHLADNVKFIKCTYSSLEDAHKRINALL